MVTSECFRRRVSIMGGGATYGGGTLVVMGGRWGWTRRDWVSGGWETAVALEIIMREETWEAPEADGTVEVGWTVGSGAVVVTAWRAEESERRVWSARTT